MFKKTKVSYTEAPLGYWEEKSYMLAIPEHEEENPLEGIFDRVETISGVEILEKRDMSDQADGYMKIRYKAEEFEVGFFPTNFHFEDYYVLPTYFFKHTFASSYLFFYIYHTKKMSFFQFIFF